MIQWRRNIMILGAMLALGAGACGSDESSSQENNDWKLGDDTSGADVSPDVGAEDGGGEDGGGEDSGGEDSGPDDATDEDGAGEDAARDAGDDPKTPLSAEGLSKPWYGVSLLSRDATTGSMLELEFRDDMTVDLGFHDEITGEWALFGEGRVRLFNLMKGDEPNEPQQILLDADVEDEHVEGLEIVIPDAGGGAPYVLRFEQLAQADVSVEDIDGNWQTEETYTAESGDIYRLVIRMIAGTFGYGGYNGAYFEFISGQAKTITYDTGETFWSSVPPPASGEPKPSLAGEVRQDDAGFSLWAPREVTPESGEFESVEMRLVVGFTDP